MSPPAHRVLSAYFRLWSITNLLRISIGFNAGTGLVGSTLDANALSLATLPALIAAAGIWPARWSGALPFAAMLVRAVTNIAKGSMMSNSQMWATQMDAAVMLAIARCAIDPSRPSMLATLGIDEERTIVGASARTIRWMLAIFYFASGFWKVNSSFLHPDYSCASIFTVQPLEYLPDHLLFATEGIAAVIVPAVARSIALIGPVATLIIEAVVPVLHALEPRSWPLSARIGVAATLAFHAVIGLTPPPSNVSTYGVTTCTRLFFVMPDAMTTAIEELAAGGSRALVLGAAATAVAAASLALVHPYHVSAVSTVQGEGIDWHLAYYMGLCVLFAHAIQLETRGGPRTNRTLAVVEAPSCRPLVVVALVYAFALPVLGLQEKAGCLMFSQLRLHGGSNHYLLPTAVLQRALVNAHPSNAFAGGVVRIEATDLEWLGNTFAEHMGPRTLRLIRQVARVPAEYVWAAKSTSGKRATPPPRFMRHTVSSLGLRRLLATASRQSDTFWLKFSRLHGAEGDEAWRTQSSGDEYIVRGRDGQIQCARIGSFGIEWPCDAHEMALLSEPSRLSATLAYFLVPQPNPIIPGHTEQMHCVTWG